MSSVELIRMWDLDYEALYYFKSLHSGNLYLAYINFDDGYAHCDCPAYTFSPEENKTCKHIKELASRFPPKREMVFDMSALRNQFLSSSLMGVNTLIGGYLPKVPYGLYGPPAAGKSIAAIEESYVLAKQMSEKQGKPVGILYYDTEGDGDILQQLWEPVLVKRFGEQKWIYMGTETEIPKTLDRKKEQDMKLMVKVCKDWGTDIFIRKEIPQSGEFKGKYRVENHGDVESKVEKIIREENVGVVIIDSISEPLDSFPGGRMNYPARADAIKLWMSQVHLLAKRYNLVVLTIHHSSKDPTSLYNKANMLGGPVLFYRYKVVMCMERVGLERKVRLARHFNKKEFDEEARIILDDDGWHDTEPPTTRTAPREVIRDTEE
jgi:hypothetical protein